MASDVQIHLQGALLRTLHHTNNNNHKQKMNSIPVVTLVLFVAAVACVPTGKITSDKEEVQKQLSVEIREQKTTTEISNHPVVRCEHIVLGDRQPRKDNHEACYAHCRNLAFDYSAGQCSEGICLCQRHRKPLEKLDELPTVKCEDIIPEGVGKASDDNDEACRAHCTTFVYAYRTGRCVEGVCHCQLKR